MQEPILLLVCLFFFSHLFYSYSMLCFYLGSFDMFLSLLTPWFGCFNSFILVFYFYDIIFYFGCMSEIVIYFYLHAITFMFHVQFYEFWWVHGVLCPPLLNSSIAQDFLCSLYSLKPFFNSQTLLTTAYCPSVQFYLLQNVLKLKTCSFLYLASFI